MFKPFRIVRVEFSGANKSSKIDFAGGPNIVYGASDTGKSFLAETIDWLLGGTELRALPECEGYSGVTLDLSVGDDQLRLRRALSGGNIALSRWVGGEWRDDAVLKQKGPNDQTDNISGFLLDLIGMPGMRVLRNAARGETANLSFRMLARLFFVQEEEISKRFSPFWTGQNNAQVVDISTVKALLTGIDDAAIVSATPDELQTIRRIERLNEQIDELDAELVDEGLEKAELTRESDRFDDLYSEARNRLRAAQSDLSGLTSVRADVYQDSKQSEERISEISDMLGRFAILANHYDVDQDRLSAIREAGSFFAHVDLDRCPMCGAEAENQHLDDDCEGDVSTVVAAATAEFEKIRVLKIQLTLTTEALQKEKKSLEARSLLLNTELSRISTSIAQATAPAVEDAQNTFEQIVERRNALRVSLDKFDRIQRLRTRRTQLEAEPTQGRNSVTFGLTDSVAFGLSRKIEHILREWNFPGECRVHYDRPTLDFVIDGKARRSRGQGLRAITHAAITIGLLEYCRERDLPHFGALVLDKPLLAYYKPEDDDETSQLKGTDLDVKFYEYLMKHHAADSQVIVIENKEPPEVAKSVKTTHFTANPNKGRCGLLEPVGPTGQHGERPGDIQ